MNLNAFCTICGKPLVPGTRFCADVKALT